MIKNYNRIRVLPYSPASKSAKDLSDTLGGKRIKLEGSSFHANHGDLVINWGNSKGWPFTMDRAVGLPLCTLFNDPSDIAAMTNKLTFFERFQGRPWLPPFWTEAEYIDDEEYPIVCRTVLNGHSGNGIVIADDPDGLVDAPLYVKYISKKEEYRVHVGTRTGVGGHIFSLQQKKRRLDFPDPNWRVRNHANGFIYAREGVNPPQCVLDAALDCFVGSGLDFGAVDVIYNHNYDRAYVLEINTAPGLTGRTLDDYAEFFLGSNS